MTEPPEGRSPARGSVRTAGDRPWAEERFRTFFEYAVEGIFRTSPEGDLLEANPSLARIFGYPSAEEMVEAVSDVAAQLYADPARREEFARLLEERGAVGGFEARGRRKDGEEVWISMNARAVRAPDGATVGFEGTVEDVTERRRAAARLRALAEASRAFAEAVPDYEALLGVVAERVSGATGDACTVRLLSEDGLWLRPVAGHHPDPELKAAIWDVMLDTAQRADAGVWRPVMEERRTIRVAVPPQGTPPDASAAQAEFIRRYPMTGIMGAPLLARGRVIGGLSLVHYGRQDPYTDDDEAFLKDLADRAALAIDNARLYGAAQEEIAERKRTEGVLRESEERFRATFEQAAVGVAHVDPGGRWIRVNDRLCRITGYPREELLGLAFQGITHPEDLEKDLGLVEKLLAGEIRTYSMEKRYLRKGGSAVWVNLTVSLVRNPSGEPEYFISVVEDVTDRKRAEEALVEIREAERGRIARDLHDGPLQDLSYGVQEVRIGRMLLEEDPQGADAALGRAEDVLVRSVREVRSAVYDLRRREGELPPGALIEALVRRHREIAPDQRVGLTVDEGVPGEPLGESGEELLWIVREALTNARRHSGAKNVAVGLRVEGGDLVAEVADDGRGIGPHARSGVGLSSMQERASALGGELEVRSAPGEGTRVRFRIPLAGLPSKKAPEG